MFDFGANYGSQQSTNFGQSQSQSQGTSQGTSVNEAGAESGSVGSSFSQSGGVSSGWNASTQDVFAGDVFQSLFRDSSNVAGSIATGGVTNAANGLFNSGASFLANLDKLGGAGPVGAGENYLANRVNGGGSLVDDQIKSLESDLTQYFGESVLPQIRSEAIGAGQAGGSREGVATGIATRGLLSELSKGIVGIRTADQAQRDAAGTSLAGIQGNRATQANAAGLGALPSLLDVFSSGQMAGLSPYLALAQILGGPTALTTAAGADSSVESAIGGSSEVATSRSSSRGESSQSSNSSSNSSSSNFGQSTGNNSGFSFGI